MKSLPQQNEERVLFLHIGTGKAGSTTIQDLLHLGDELSPEIRPLKAFGHPNAVNLVAASKSPSGKRYFVHKTRKMTEEYFESTAERIWEETLSELAKSPVNRFVASSEFLSSIVHADNIDYLKARLLTCFDRVEIIVYLREQCSYLRSLWGQSVKGRSRSCLSFTEFVNDLEKRPRLWDYSLLIREWQNAFGKDSLKVGVFDERAFHGGDLISDFCHKIGISTICDRNGLSERKNVSPSFEEIEAIRRKNARRSISTLVGYYGRLKLQRQIAQDTYEALVIRMSSPGNAWINENFLSSQAVKLPVA